MNIITYTKSGPQVIFPVSPPLKEGEINSQITKTENEDDLFRRHEEKYKDFIDLRTWKEIILVLPKTTKIDFEDFKLLTTTSYELQAYKKEQVDTIISASMEGLILTNDNKFVFGIRGGTTERGKVCTVPAGALSFPFKGDCPIFGNFYSELEEELGIQKNELSEEPILIGYHIGDSFTKALNLIIYGKTIYNSHELYELHERAFNIYQTALKSSVEEMAARELIKKKELPNVDAWEHQKLIFIDPKSIQSIIDSRTIYEAGREFPLLDIGRATLILYQNINT